MDTQQMVMTLPKDPYEATTEQLIEADRAKLQEWEAHHITAEGVGGPSTLSNCQILCIPCHTLTQTYGSSG